MSPSPLSHLTPLSVSGPPGPFKSMDLLQKLTVSIEPVTATQQHTPHRPLCPELLPCPYDWYSVARPCVDFNFQLGLRIQHRMSSAAAAGMRPHSSFVGDASSARSPPSSPSGSPRPPPGKRPTLLKQLTSLLIVAIMLATTGSVTLVLSRVGDSGRAAEGPDAWLRAAPLPLPPVESDDNLVSLFPQRHRNVTSTTPGALPKVLILTPVKNSARHIARCVYP